MRIDDGRALPDFIATSELPRILDSTDPVALKAQRTFPVVLSISVRDQISRYSFQ